MFKVVQVSDLHFGCADAHVIEAGANIIREIQPDLLIVAGDLTQRNWSWQFFQAVQFFKSFDCPLLMVPGNHDMPFFNLFVRFRKPMKHYQKYFSDQKNMLFENDFLNVVGINSTNRFHVKDGKLKKIDLLALEKSFQETAAYKWNILVTHHPLSSIHHVKAPLISPPLEKTHLWLAGHLHHFRFEPLEYQGKKLNGYQCVSGTFVSNRLRSEQNSFNLFEFHGKSMMTLTPYFFHDMARKFVPSQVVKVHRKSL